MMKLSEYNPMAREAFARGLLDISTAIFKGVFLLITVAPLAAFLKTLLDDVEKISIIDVINALTFETQVIFIGLFVASIGTGFFTRHEGLKHLHELEHPE